MEGQVMALGYFTRSQVTDFGPYLTQIILPLGKQIRADQVSPETFSVYVERMTPEGAPLMVPKVMSFDPEARKERIPSKGMLTVKAAYPSDRFGTPADEGTFITLDIAHGPTEPLAAELAFVEAYNVCIPTVHIIRQFLPVGEGTETVTGLVFDCKLEAERPDITGWQHGCSSTAAEPLRYGYFIPQRPGDKKPLVIWLHGAGEGGYDIRAAYSGNKVTALAKEEVQDFFGETGAFILAPQCETYWMDSGSGTIMADGRTKYGQALMDCIEDFISKNPSVDRKRILIGGDSNGGFMTMWMILHYPAYFAAAFPVCEAFPDRLISNGDLQIIRNIPIWFTAAKTDRIVPPSEYCESTYLRLKKIGAKNVHFTYWDKIEDLHGLAPLTDGKPYEYFGHFSWIPLFNNDCRLDYDGMPVKENGKEVTALEWLGLQKKG